MPTMELFFYGFTLWLGAYLLARNSQKITVHVTGWGSAASNGSFHIKRDFIEFPLLRFLSKQTSTMLLQLGILVFEPWFLISLKFAAKACIVFLRRKSIQVISEGGTQANPSVKEKEPLRKAMREQSLCQT
jgi:hypothetical protein